MLRPLAWALLVFAAFSSGAQSVREHSSTAAAPVTPEQEQLWNRYQQTLEDSAVYQRWNVRPLRPLVPDEHGEVLVATLTSSDQYVVGQPVTYKKYTWVTGVPEVQDICRAFHGDVRMQLRELIGLPPDENISHAVVLRVHASDIFRPSPWPDIDTRWPCGVSSVAQPDVPNCGNAFPPKPDAAHVAWMASASFSLHAVPDGYPWTHLGYTYNWAPNADRYGASEYVIRKDAQYPIVVVSNVTPEAYCAPAPQ
jgi:hypothetical protein